MNFLFASLSLKRSTVTFDVHFKRNLFYFEFLGTGTVRFKCEDDYITMHEDCDLAIIKTKVRIEGRPVSIPRNESEHPNIGDYVYAVGWGRACDDPGEDCKSEDRRPNILQVLTFFVNAHNNFEKGPQALK